MPCSDGLAPGGFGKSEVVPKLKSVDDEVERITAIYHGENFYMDSTCVTSWPWIWVNHFSWLLRTIHNWMYTFRGDHAQDIDATLGRSNMRALRR